MQLNYPAELPIVSYREALLELLQDHQVIIVSGETGSGKTTQLPKFCLEFFPDTSFLIGCTQPRRVAATSVSSRVASELAPHKDLVGYKIRFHDKTTKNTRIKFMTDGVLLAETRQDPLLKRYGVIIIDEAHERSLNIDFLLGYLKNLLPKRPDLKLIITSATIDTEIFSKHFNNAPVLSVEGRSFPVEVRYIEPESDKEEISYVEQCVETIQELHRREPPEDTLIFLPTEKDIRECCGLLEGKLSGCLILPMFGRLAAADQKKIFKSSKLTKIVVATNVAETSITVPGIRYVVDSGLARISQYNVRARTTSLPITRVSRASADQRKGRCGRVGPGICIRLYSEEDYLDRDQYMLPEIKRSNLADVILQMISMDLGSPVDFPFIEPPHPGAIRDGYNLLKELGALTENNKLNHTGQLMARLPIDPPISRILIAARENNCVREITIIAPALAIQDPRVRPSEKETEADNAHKKFAHEHSDFLGLLNIWDLFHDVREKGLSWNRLKKFCKSHYLSFQRMREWIDLHEQLSKLLEREKGFVRNKKPAPYPAIHKSLCTGFLRNIGLKKENEKGRDKKLYQGAGGKEFMIFPGSHQFHSSGKWIIGAAFLETNRLYALTVANVEPNWLIEAGDHLCRRSWSNPRWQKKSGQVVADEKISLFGLILSADRIVNFGRTSLKNREEARQIFIQHGLLDQELKGNYPFLQNNLEILKKWQETEERLRKRDLLVDDTSLHLFYDKRLPPSVYDRFTLNRFLKKKKDHSFLEMTEEDILNRRPEDRELQDFPKYLTIGSHKLRLSYHLAPGEEDDGVTARIPLDAVESFSETSFEWLVPGLIREKVTFLLKGLPKRIRKHLIPVNNTVDLLLDDCTHYQGSLYHALELGIFKMFRLKVARTDWPDQLPAHLEMRYLLYDSSGRTAATGRKLHELVSHVHTGPVKKISPNQKISKALAPWQDKIFQSWDFDRLERRIPLYTAGKEIAGYLYPTLHIEKNRGGVSITFENDRQKAYQLNREGSLYLYQLHFKDQFKNLKKYCSTRFSGPSSHWLFNKFGNKNKANDALLGFIMGSLFTKDLETIPSKNKFDEEVKKIQQLGLYKKGQEICDELFQILRKRREVSEHISRFASLAQKSHSFNAAQYKEYDNLLEEILPDDFLTGKSVDDLTGCTRFFQALMIRIERAHANPTKDQTKAKQLEPYLDRIKKIPDDCSTLPLECRQEIALYKSMINEFRVTVFAPELKGGTKVSAKKLKLQWQAIQSLCPGI
ncbi:MAG TPA: ATP-dependent RNA helicase HrpA [Desulfobacterales bacterium]|nr:ATP-dependent RNA helicase HrpA [Desulfobacterales bacterium]HIP40217.1 ATP-dependent RNA helicase HrpA [Desulfocapsa sulfexigens]